jgi:hypothetical protein
MSCDMTYGPRWVGLAGETLSPKLDSTSTE